MSTHADLLGAFAKFIVQVEMNDFRDGEELPPKNALPS
jgi:hypothetical protein